MSESSDDDMPLIARRRPQGEIPVAAAAAKPTPSTAAPVRQEVGHAWDTPAANDGSGNASNPSEVAAQPAEKYTEQPAAKPPANKRQEAGSDSSDDSDDDVPLAARSNPAKAELGVKKAVENGEDKHQPVKHVDTKNPAAAAAKRKSSDGGSKKPVTANGKAAAAKQQQAVRQESQLDKKPAAAVAAAKKAPAGNAAKAAASDAGGKQARVKKEFDLPGQTRETPDETDPLRKFYTSLLQEKPESFMARKWCVMNGLLTREEAQDFIKQNKGGRAVAATPTKAPPARAKAAAKRPAASNGKKAPATKRAAAGDSRPKAKPAPKRKAAAKKDKLDWDDSESGDADGDDDSSSDDEVPLAQRKAAKI